MTKQFIISDLHLNHYNIIQYCHRPFTSLNEMNTTIVERWNEVVNDNDMVYFLGDFCMGKPGTWLSRMNGNILFIRGNHDRGLEGIHPVVESVVIRHNDEEILLIHAKNYLKFPWDGWILHGHHHNNDLENYPFLHQQNKTMNVSAELLDYYPIELSKLLEMRGVITDGDISTIGQGIFSDSRIVIQ